MGLSTLSVHSLAWHATPWMILSGVGMGMMMPPLSVAVQNSVENADLAAATSANSFFRTLGQTFGVAGLGAVMAARLRTELAARVPSEQLGKLDIRSLTGSLK